MENFGMKLCRNCFCEFTPGSEKQPPGFIKYHKQIEKVYDMRLCIKCIIKLARKDVKDGI